MILTNRLFTRREPEKGVKSVYIFCEGKKREYQYFRYFRGIDTKINIEVYPLEGDENNSPTGLYEIAVDHIVKSEENPAPKYEFIDGDEVWFVIDTDRWGSKIPTLRKYCSKHDDWKIAQSNPCFEVWLYYHLFDVKANFDFMEACKEWKTFLNENVNGGFDSQRHPIFISTAIENTRKHYNEVNGQPDIGTSEVFRLATVIYAVCRWKIENILNKI